MDGDSSEECYNPDTTWSITDPSQGARTIEENLELSTKHGKKFNVSRPPLFPMILLWSLTTCISS